MSSSLRAAPAPYPRAVVWTFFVGLALIWGSSFLFIKIGLDAGLPPFTLVVFRLLIACTFLAVLVRLTHGRLPDTRDAWRRFVTLGTINVAFPFLCIAWGEQFIGSGVTSVLNALVPLFTIVIAAFVLHDEPITLNRLAGLGVGFGGAVLIASPNLGSTGAVDGTQALIGELAVAVGCASYACGAVFTRHSITGRPLITDPVTGPRVPRPEEIALPQLGVALVITLVPAILFEHPAGGLLVIPPDRAAWLAVTWLGILGSGVAYLLFFRIVRAWGATRTTLVTYAMPVVGIALGVVILDERLDAAEVLGSALVLCGLLLANAPVGQRRLFGRTSAPQPTASVPD